jgi:hypothetical protein
MRRLVTIATAAYGVGAVAMFAWLLPRVSAACGQAPLDGRFQWSAVEAVGFASACGESGLTAYRALQFADLIYPALLGLTLVSWALVLGRPGWMRTTVVALAVMNVVADYTENAAAWTMLAGGADWPHSPLLVVVPVVTVIKNLAGAAAFAGVGLLAVGATWRWRESRRVRTGQI